MEKADAEVCRGFVISGGRTGTVWLTHTLDEQFEHVTFEHEPSPCRIELMLGNLRNRHGLVGGFTRRYFLANRRRRWAKLPQGTSYVEVNPMLCPITDLLEKLAVPINVVHQVRDPRTWTASMVRFKASVYFRHLINYIPFAIPYPAERPADWRRLSLAEKTLWRWRHTNEQILRIKEKCQRYTLVRYEDMFAPDDSVREQAMRQTLATLDLPSEDLSWLNFETRINPAPKAGADESLLDDEVIYRICGDLMEQFGYE